MPKCFPKLTQTHVRLDVAEEKSIAVRMLPISRMDELKRCTEGLRKTKTMEQMEEVKKRMVALAREVIPAEYAENLERFPLDALAELLGYLMYGDGDDQPELDSEVAEIVPAKN